MKTIMTLSKKPTKQALLFCSDSGRSVWQYSTDGEQRTDDMQRAIPGSSVKLALMLVVLLMALPAFRAQAEPASDPAGFYRITCLGNSDTIVSIPFSRPAAANVVVESVAQFDDDDNGEYDRAVVTLKGAPGWTEDQFVYAAGTQPNTYYVRFLSGAKEGSYYPVTANDADSLTLSLRGDDISSVADGDQAAVIPYWTLGTVFPEGRGVIPSSTIGIRNSEVLIPYFEKIGINLGTSATYFFLVNASFPNGVWRKVGVGTGHDDDVLLPDVYFIVRHNTAANTVVTAQGSVSVSKLAIPLITQPTPTNQDNFITLARPVPITLLESGLVQSGAFLPSVSLGTRTDELLVFDNGQVAQNKPATATYFYLNGTWRRLGMTGDWGNEPVFTPGTGVIIRKAATADGVSAIWMNSPTY